MAHIRRSRPDSVLGFDVQLRGVERMIDLGPGLSPTLTVRVPIPKSQVLSR